MRRLAIALAVLLAIAVAVVALFPARVALDLVLAPESGLVAEQVSGTIWTGRIGDLRQGDQYLGALDWRLHPLPLLRGQVATDLRLAGGEIGLQASLLRRSATELDITDLVADLPAAALAPVIDLQALELLGRIELRFERIELLHLWPRRLGGEAVWRDARVAGAAEARLGELVAEFETSDDGRLHGTVRDRGGPLAIDGRFEIGLRGYEVHAELRAPPGERSLQEALQYIGEALPDGGRLLRVEGGPSS